MEVITHAQISEWLRLDPDQDTGSIDLLVNSAIDIIEHETQLILRPFTDPLTNLIVTPFVPQSIKHAIAVFVSSHFDDRLGDNEAAMLTLKRLCAPWKAWFL